MRRFLAQITGLFRRARHEREMNEELESHFALHIDENLRAGMRPDEARRAARLKFGSLDATRDSHRETRGFPFFESILKDVLYGIRGLRRSPGFTATAILSLALGTGAALSIFTIADHLLLRPLPYRHPERLVMVWETSPADRHNNVVSPANYLDWKARSRSFESISVFRQGRAVLRDGSRSEELIGVQAGPELLASLGVAPMRGRLYTSDEPTVETQAVRPIVISYRLWQSWFGGADSALGRNVVVNGEPRTVAGVMPEDFYFLDRRVDLWEPLVLEPNRNYRKDSGRYLMSVGRLRPGVSVKSAQAELAAIASELERAYPAFNKNWGVEIEPLRDTPVREVKTSIWILLAAVGLLLLVACANVANLLLARFVARQREMALRASIGASYGRLVRQLLIESALLGLASAALGLGLAQIAVSVLLSLAPAELTRTAAIAVDFRVALFALLLSVGTTALFGTLPAILAARRSTSEVLKSGSRTHSGGQTRGWLVCGEVALSVVLLVGSGLLLRSFLRLQSVDPGLKSSGVLTFRLSPSPARYPTDEQRQQFFTSVLDRIKHAPGVVAASAVSSIPFNADTAGLAGTSVKILGEPEPEPGKGKEAMIRSVMPGSFEVYRIPIRAGRDIADADNAVNAPYRFIVNEEFAHRYLQGRDPLKTSLSAWMDTNNPFGEIIGVVGNVKEGALDKAPEPTVYYVHAHLPYGSMFISVRTQGNPANLSGAVRGIVNQIDPSQPVAELRTMEDVLSATLDRQRFSSVLLAGFSIASLLLAAIGIFGVLNYLVSERSRELGVRLALGARSKEIVGLVVWSGMRFVIAGIVLGCAGAALAAKSIQIMLFEVAPYDGLTFAAAGGAILISALAAAWLPAARAAATDPMQVLRAE
jgi:putative ABC transport system permease protein